MKVIAISGGIGSGKSVVSEILRCMGFGVYDCDSEARRIMDSDPSIHAALCRDIHCDVVKDGLVNRQLLSEIAFNDAAALKKLNSIVHGAVFADFARWCKVHEEKGEAVAFVESAILHSSGLVDYVDEEWSVTAPIEVRIQRVIKRSGLNESQIKARIEAQAAEENNSASSKIPVRLIDNSPSGTLLPQIHSALPTF